MCQVVPEALVVFLSPVVIQVVSAVLAFVGRLLLVVAAFALDVAAAVAALLVRVPRQVFECFSHELFADLIFGSLYVLSV